MATIKYRCSICKRNIEILEKPYTLTVYSKCIITDGCKGKLNKLSRNPDNIRESIPSPINGLNDYVQRKIFYQHTQNLINTIWTITHNLGVFPVIEIYVTNDIGKMELKFDDYKVDIIDKNTVKVTFPTPQTGVAHCIARSSVPEYNLIKSNDISLFKVTFNGIFVFAFPKLITHFTIPPTVTPTPSLPIDTTTVTRPIRLEISMIQPNKEEIICTETIPSINSNLTPWIGWNEILLRKRRNYEIKTKSIFNFNRTLQADEILPEDIPNGTQIRFLRVDYGTGDLQPIEQDDVLLLLANSPYQPIDKIKNKIIDTGHVLFSSFDHFVYENGEIYTSDSNLESIYPTIQKVN